MSLFLKIPFVFKGLKVSGGGGGVGLKLFAPKLKTAPRFSNL
jgi:hypothetical protein